MRKRTFALIAGAAVVAGGLAIAQTTAEGMDMEGMDHSGMNMNMNLSAMGGMDHNSLIPPEFAKAPATLAYAKVRIPRKMGIDSTASRAAIPREDGHLI